MSETVIDSGKLIPLSVNKEWALAECKRLNVDVDLSFETAFESLSNETDQYAIIAGLGFCRVEDFISISPCGGWQNIKANGDGSYDFSVCYYDGGGHWTEVVEAAIKEGLDDGHSFKCA